MEDEEVLVALGVVLLMKGHGDDSAKWAEWEAEPKPYGGFQVLSKIRRAKERNITELNLSKNKITDVTPLPWLTNLTTLNLLDNQISDLSPLEGLTKLTALGLHDNNITDLSALAKLTKLEGLDLRSNNITDLTPLAGLTNLRVLYLTGNPIPDEQKVMLKKALRNCRILF